MSRCAAIDLGTNTALMLVAERPSEPASHPQSHPQSHPKDAPLEVVEEHAAMPRLGAGLARTGRLCEVAMGRALAALERYARRIDELGLEKDRVRAVGTAVLRRAGDARQFVERVHRQTGLLVEILPEEEEARLGHLGATAGFDSESARNTLIIDVGGGSTEIVGDQGRTRMSLPIGAVVLTEALLGTAEQAASEPGGWPALRARVEQTVKRFPAGLARDGAEVLCLGGTPLNLACLELGLPRFDANRAEQAALAVDAARRQAERLAPLDQETRAALPIQGDRADVLPAGLLCLGATLERIGATRARATGRGLRHGIAWEMLHAPGRDAPIER